MYGVGTELREEMKRLVIFEQGLKADYEAQGGTMANTAVIVPLTTKDDEARHVTLALQHAIGLQISSPGLAQFRLAHPECEDGVHDGNCVLSQFTDSKGILDPDEATAILVRLMTVSSIIETAGEMAHELLQELE